MSNQLRTCVGIYPLILIESLFRVKIGNFLLLLRAFSRVIICD